MKSIVDKVQSVLKTKTFLVIISILCAIIAWLVAIDSSNPNVEKTFNVNIQYINFSGPAQKSLTLVENLGVVSAEIKVSGREKLLDKVTAEDFTVTMDFNEIQGPGTTYLTVSSPKCDKLGVKIIDYSPKGISVEYDQKMELYLPVRVNAEETILSSGYEILSATVVPEVVPMSGFSADLENLEYIVVNLSDQIKDNSVDDDKTLTLIGRYMTSTGNDVTAKYDTEKFTVKLNVAKRVPIKYNIVGEINDDYYVEKVICNRENVLLDDITEEAGKTLIGIASVDLGDISIENAKETIEYKTTISELFGGKGIACVNEADDEIVVDIIVRKYETKTYTIKKSNIALKGRDTSKFDYSVTYGSFASGDTIKVTLKGKASDLDEITTSSIYPTLEYPTDVGSYPNEKIRFTIPAGVYLVGEYRVSIDVKVKATPTPIPSLEPTATPEATPESTPN